MLLNHVMDDDGPVVLNPVADQEGGEEAEKEQAG
jgi:hypothetical protein